MIAAQITGSRGGAIAKVTSSGELVVAPLSYSETQFKELAVDNTAYNFYAPKPNKQFVITGIVAKADRDVATATDASVIVYEADEEDSLTVKKVLYQDAMVRGEKISLTDLKILVNAGVYINAKTSDDDIHMTIMGYYIEEL